MARKTPEEIRKSISAPISSISDPRARLEQKVKRKALVLQMKGGLKKRRAAKVLKSVSTPKITEQKKGKGGSGFKGLAQKLRDRFPE